MLNLGLPSLPPLAILSTWTMAPAVIPLIKTRVLTALLATETTESHHPHPLNLQGGVRRLLIQAQNCHAGERKRAVRRLGATYSPAPRLHYILMKSRRSITIWLHLLYLLRNHPNATARYLARIQHTIHLLNNLRRYSQPDSRPRMTLLTPMSVITVASNSTERMRKEIMCISKNIAWVY